MDPLLLNETFSDFCSLRAKISGTVHIRPDICCSVSLSSQITEKIFSTETINEINNIFYHLKKNSDLQLQYPTLYVNFIHLREYFDAEFSSTEDLIFHFGYVVLLADKHGKYNVIYYASKKSKRYFTFSTWS